jgi:hypothetical protein
MERYIYYEELYNGGDYPLRVDLRDEVGRTSAVVIPPRDFVRVRAGFRILDTTPLVDDTRVRELYERLLTQEERTLLQEQMHLTVKSRLHRGITYLVPQGCGVVGIMRRGHIVAQACLVPKTPLPVYDWLFLRLLLLEGDEEEFLRHARITVYPRSRGRTRHGLDWLPIDDAATR